MTQALMLSPSQPPMPAPRPRPPLDRWLRDHDLDDAAFGQLVGCSKQMVNAMRRPFSDPSRKVPGRDLLTRIVRATGGAIRPGDFSPPVEAILRGETA